MPNRQSCLTLSSVRKAFAEIPPLELMKFIQVYTERLDDLNVY